MTFRIIRQDITKIKVDAIVNAANESLLGGGGVDGAIHRAAGRELLEECRKLNGCETGQAKYTKGYKLPAKYVIHTVGPIYGGGKHGEAELLASCYANSLKIARELGCKSIAFPLISSGAYGYPKKEALQIAINEISSFLFENKMDIYICVWSDEVCDLVEQLFPNLKEYISSHYVAEHTDAINAPYCSRICAESKFRLRKKRNLNETISINGAPEPCLSAYSEPASMDDILQKAKAEYENRFPELLTRLMKEKNLKSKDVCIRSNITKQLFSDLKKTEYHTKKDTVLALSIGMKLDKVESDILMQAAGYTYSNGEIRDIIVKFCIENRQYNIFALNILLDDAGLPLLGTKPRE